jgi:hypothetical protein
MEFKLTVEQMKKYKAWFAKLKKEYTGAIGGGIEFIFEPTGIGDIVKVRYLGKHELDLTETDTW